MKKVDILKLRLKGVSAEEIKQLMELETMAEDSDIETDREDDPAADPVPANDPEEDEEVNEKSENDDSIEKMKEEITQLKADLIKAQKANLKKDISGSEDQTDDQDVVNDLVRSFM